jgi:hypothetical protein
MSLFSGLIRSTDMIGSLHPYGRTSPHEIASLAYRCVLVLRAARLQHRGANKITAAEAKDHVGETRTVCGKVVSTDYASGSKGQPTFLNLEELSEGSFHDLNLGQRSREIQNARNEISGCEGVPDRENHEPREKPEIIVSEPNQIVQEK